MTADWWARGLGAAGAVSGLGSLAINFRDQRAKRIRIAVEPELLLHQNWTSLDVDVMYRDVLQVKVVNHSPVDVEITRLSSNIAGLTAELDLGGAMLPHTITARSAAEWDIDPTTLWGSQDATSEVISVKLGATLATGETTWCKPIEIDRRLLGQ